MTLELASDEPIEAIDSGQITDQEWDEAVALVRRARRILLCTHRKPDGDAVGSVLGFGHALAGSGKQVTLACADPADNNLALLPGAQDIVSDLRPLYAGDGELPWDLIVALDAADLGRLGVLYEANAELFSALPIVNLDHHFTNTRFGVANLVDAKAASATEVIAMFLERLGIVPSVKAATCLLAGLMTDSLSFQTESTTPRTLRVAASLVEAGAPLGALSFQLFRQRPRSSAILWSRALGTLQFGAEGRLAWFEVTRQMVEASGSGADTSGLSGFAGSIAGVDVGMQIEEGKDGNVYAGFRSQTVDVAELAGRFGGGGHQRAAGCQFRAPATLESARQQLVPAVEAYLAERLVPSPPPVNSSG